MGRRVLPPEARAEAAPLKALSRWGAEARHTFTEVELEIIRRLLEREEPASVRKNLGLSVHEFDKLFRHPRFQREFELQAQVADRDIRSRLDRLAHESLDVVREVMRTSVNPGNRLRAAMEILDRSGYVKIEKRITITADAESVIRELNRIGGAAPHSDDDAVVDDTEEAVLSEVACTAVQDANNE